MRFLAFALLFTGAFAVSETVPTFDFDRHAGTWHVMARLPSPFESGLTNVTATYVKRTDGKMDFVNRGFKSAAGGKPSQVTGTLSPGDAAHPGKLTLRVFGIIPADYWILDVDPEYRTALIGGKKKNRLWVFSRTDAISPERMTALLEKAKSLGYDLKDLERFDRP